MRTNLFHLPPEILLQVLEDLPVTPLLRFAQTCKCARSLAHSSIKNLSLAIYPCQQTSWHKKLLVARDKPKYTLNTAIRIPRAWDFDFSTLAKFHDKIIASILTRHAYALQRLELTIWKVSVPIAKAIIQLPALRQLSLRVESNHAVPRAYITVQRREERVAWSLLAANPAWASSIEALTVQNAELNATQLLELFDVAERLQDLRLSGCDMMTSTLWSASNLQCLHHLSLTGCTNIHVNEVAIEAISKMNKLQVLDLHGCSGLDGEVLEQWNKDVWCVPVFVAPRPRGGLKDNVFIEVDPEYMIEVGEN